MRPVSAMNSRWFPRSWAFVWELYRILAKPLTSRWEYALENNGRIGRTIGYPDLVRHADDLEDFYRAMFPNGTWTTPPPP